MIVAAICLSRSIVVVAHASLVGLAYRPVRGDDRLAVAVDEMRTKMDDLGRDLSGALERAEREA